MYIYKKKNYIHGTISGSQDNSTVNVCINVYACVCVMCTVQYYNSVKCIRI